MGKTLSTPEAVSVLTAIIVLAISYLLVKHLNRKRESKNKHMPN